MYQPRALAMIDNPALSKLPSITETHWAYKGNITANPSLNSSSSGATNSMVPPLRNTLFYGLLIVTFLLLCICALLAGLTLALAGLDMRTLRIKCVAGTSRERRRAAVVYKMRSHATWMLCSLIICSVACNETIPLIIQYIIPDSHAKMDGRQWIPILISTLSIAIFAEILPQYIIPKRAIDWGYFCWPIIWAAMWLSGIVSYPLARLLDCLSGSTTNAASVFTNEELAILLKYHERSQKNGGILSQDTIKIMLGALSLNSSTIGSDVLMLGGKDHNGNIKDIEKADPLTTRGIIVKWNKVKCVNIDDIVDEEFIQKTKSWSFSRIPVVGNSSSNPIYRKGGKSPKLCRLFGFLHTKNLIGISIPKIPQPVLLVKDLILYPVPIVHDNMHAYDLLNMFQLGMSRIAVVIPTPNPNPIWFGNLGRLSTRVINTPTPPQWTTKVADELWESYRASIKATDLWATSLFEAANGNITTLISSEKDSLVGIECLEPLGIITFEDIIDTILQKTSKDEKDVFERKNSSPVTEIRDRGDSLLTSERQALSSESSVIIPESKESHSTGILRKRNVSGTTKPQGGMDGIDELSNEGSAGSDSIQKIHSTSLQFENIDSQGPGALLQRLEGYNRREAFSLRNLEIPKLEDVYESDFVAPPARRGASGEATNLHSYKKSLVAILPESIVPFWKHVCETSNPRIPPLRRVSPLSNEELYDFESVTRKLNSLSRPASPKRHSSMPSGNLIKNATTILDQKLEKKCPTRNSFSVSVPRPASTSDNDLSDNAESTIVNDSQIIPTSGTLQVETKGYQLGESDCKTPKMMYSYSRTLPEKLPDPENDGCSHHYDSTRASQHFGPLTHTNSWGGPRSSRERSFHDDRALLPSQRKLTKAQAVFIGPRTSSLRF